MLSAYKYIKEKQIQWAKNQGKPLIGSEDERGESAYTSDLEENLFKPLLDSVKEAFKKGNGNEINDHPPHQAKMKAVHSSSALTVNVFQYWEMIHQVPMIAAACRFCRKGTTVSESIVFEEKFDIIGVTGGPPNIDVVIQNSDDSPFKYFAIESKFSEPYNPCNKNKKLEPAYLNVKELWEDIPNLHDFARSISPENTLNKYLDSAQLVRHILGLKSCCAKDRFKLLYLWNDALREAGAEHKAEIDAFARIAKDDGIHFSSLTYQELIVWLAKEYRQEHPGYVKYLTERYL